MPTLLIVDDVIDNIHVLATALRGMGHCIFATDGPTATALADKARPDIILLDAEMPGMDGFEVCAHLKRQPGTAHIPVIFVTAFSDMEHETRALGVGAVDFIAKPISRPVVRARVQAHLTLKSQADSTRNAMQALVEASPQPMAIVTAGADGAATVNWANRHFTDLVLPIETLLPAAWGRARQTVGEGRRWSGDLLVDRPDGGAELEVIFTPISELGTIMVTARDRTADRRAARQEAERLRLEALGRMAGRIAHEINNVLQPIMSHASLARHASDGNAVALEHIDDIQDAVRHGRDIVRSVLAVAGGHAATRQARELDAEVARTLDLLRPSLPATVSLSLALHPAGGPVELSSAELLQVLGNLIGNAVDAVAGSGAIAVSTGPAGLTPEEAEAMGLPAGRHAELVVSDAGCGMDPATLQRAFDPFFTTKAVDRGSGLGLPTVRTVVESMGGKIGISSAPGRGTAVRVVFPVPMPAC